MTTVIPAGRPAIAALTPAAYMCGKSSGSSRARCSLPGIFRRRGKRNSCRRSAGRCIPRLRDLRFSLPIDAAHVAPELIESRIASRLIAARPPR